MWLDWLLDLLLILIYLLAYLFLNDLSFIYLSIIHLFKDRQLSIWCVDDLKTTKLFDKTRKLINLQYIELRCYFSSAYVTYQGLRGVRDIIVGNPRVILIDSLLERKLADSNPWFAMMASYMHRWTHDYVIMYMIYLIKESDLFLLTAFYLGQIRCSSSYLGLTISRYPCPVKEVQHHECREFR